jgi:rod shape-determining protein MreC
MMRSENSIYSALSRYHILIISVLLALFSLHLALTDKKQVERGYVVRGILSFVVDPLQNSILTIYWTVSGMLDDYTGLMGVKDENAALKITITALKDKNNRLTEEIALGARLKGLLDYKETVGFATVAAGVQAFNIERWTRTIIINKGTDDNTAKDMSVITPSGVVGRIIQAGSGSSRVLLTTDLRSDIDVILQRTRTKGIVEGNGTDGMTLKYIRELDDVRIGDTLVTSGFAGIYPKGLVVGTVKKIKPGTDNFFKRIEVAPSVDINRLEDVLVVMDGAAAHGF